MKNKLALIGFVIVGIFTGCSESPTQTQQDAFAECFNRCEYFTTRLWENENVYHQPPEGYQTKYPTNLYDLEVLCTMNCSQPE